MPPASSKVERFCGAWGCWLTEFRLAFDPVAMRPGVTDWACPETEEMNIGLAG